LFDNRQSVNRQSAIDTRQSAKSYRRNLFAVTAASFIGFMGFTLVMPFLPLYFHQLGVTSVGEVALWSGLSLGVTPGLTALLAPFWGRLADRFGRKIMVERSLVSFVVVMASMAFVTRAWHVFALRSLQGLFAGYGALTLTMAADSAPRDRMAQAIGTVQTAQRLGPALGPVVGGTVAAIVGLRRAFLIASLFYLFAVLLVLLLYEERQQESVHADVDTETRTVTFQNLLAFENFLLMMAVIFVLQFVDRSFGPVLSLYVGQLGLSPNRTPLISGVLFSIAAGAGALGHHFCAALLRWRPPARVIAYASGLAALGGALYIVARDVRLLFLATPVFGLAIGAGMTAAYTAAASVIPGTARGAGFGLLTTASLVGLAVSPMVSGILGATSIRAVFGLDVIALATIGLIVIRTTIRRADFDRNASAEASAAEEPVVSEL
jgi:DHA1 family multidrug resistance protein-like MFS transporter